jgi:protein gp37
MNISGIEWLLNDDGSKGCTCNPVIGCDEHSAGCRNCWAKYLVATRMIRNPVLPMYHDLARMTEGGKAQWTGVVKLVPERLKDIVGLGARETGTRVFICDMSDLFHKDVPFEYIAAVLGATACAPLSLFYLLTKRAERAAEFDAWFQGPAHAAACLSKCWPGNIRASVFERVKRAQIGANIAFGVTCEDKKSGVPRLALGRKFRARWHWTSVEPLLEDLGADVDFSGYDLVVAGGESGPDSRQFHAEWSDNVLAATRKAGARFFMKQLGDDAHDANEPLNAGRKGNVLEYMPERLRIRENIPMPNAA